MSAFCTLYMGYFPLRFVLDALESHPKTSCHYLTISFWLYTYIFLSYFRQHSYSTCGTRKPQRVEESSLDIEILETKKKKNDTRVFVNMLLMKCLLAAGVLLSMVHFNCIFYYKVLPGLTIIKRNMILKWIK